MFNFRADAHARSWLTPAATWQRMNVANFVAFEDGAFRLAATADSRVARVKLFNAFSFGFCELVQCLIDGLAAGVDPRFNLTGWPAN